MMMETNQEKKEGHRRCMELGPVARTHKNVYGLGFSFFAVFCSFQGLQNLQSSINDEGGLGLVTLALLYAFFFLSGFISPAFVNLFGTKYSLLIGMFCHLLYTLSNYYGSWYTLAPSSVLLGLASAPVWAAASTHITLCAIQIAPVVKEKEAHLISQYTGVMFLFFQFSSIPGNLCSSLILCFNDEPLINSSSNTSSIVSNGTCQHDSKEIEYLYLYLLISVYVVFVAVAITSEALLVDKFPRDAMFFSTKRKFRVFLVEPVKEMLKVLFDWKMLLLTPMGLANGLEQSFLFGTFTKLYISDCLGVCYVGYALAMFGFVSAISSFTAGRIVKYIPRFVVMLTGASINTVLLTALFVLGEPGASSSYSEAFESPFIFVIVFVFCAAWGIGDAIWNTMFGSVVGILFPKCLETAYSVARLWLAMGFIVGFVLALDFVPREVLLGTVMFFVVVGFLLYLTVELLTSSSQDTDTTADSDASPTDDVKTELASMPQFTNPMFRRESINPSPSYAAALNLVGVATPVHSTGTSSTASGDDGLSAAADLWPAPSAAAAESADTCVKRASINPAPSYAAALNQLVECDHAAERGTAL